jgi:hypothetical protein
MSKKIKVKESDFLSWYFSDLDDILTFGRNMITELQSQGFVKESVQSLLDRCGYIPGHISENPDDDKEYDPEDVELISERDPEHCYKCGHEYDNTMDNFCSNCLALK